MIKKVLSAPQLDDVRSSRNNSELAASLRRLADSIDNNEIYFNEISTTLVNGYEEIGTGTLNITFVIKPEYEEESA